MPTMFDDGWSAGPFGPPPLWFYSQTDVVSERNYLLYGLGGAAVYQLAGALVQYGIAGAVTTPTLFRRTISARTGSRGIL
jgi:hypothetical protein